MRSLLTFFSLAALSLSAAAAPLHLARGGAATITVIGSKKSTATGVQIRSGEVYEVTALPNQKWIDLFIPCTAAGFSSEEHRVFKKFDHELRDPHANWLSLCGAVGCGPAFALGLQGRVPAKSQGELTLFANDVSWGYWDNLGSIKVQVRRVK